MEEPKASGQIKPADVEYTSLAPSAPSPGPEALSMLSPFGALQEPLQAAASARLHTSLAEAEAAHKVQMEGLRQQLREAATVNKELQAAVSAGVEAQRLQAEQAEQAKDRAHEQHMLELAADDEVHIQQMRLLQGQLEAAVLAGREMQSSMEATITSRDVQVAALQGQLDEAGAAAEELHTQMAATEARHKVQVKELREQLLASGATVDSMQAEVDGLQTLLEEAGEESLSLRASMAAADFAHAVQTKDLEEQLEKAGPATLELKVEIAVADAARNKQVRALQHQLAEAGAAAQVLEAGIAASDAARNLQVRSLQAQLEASTPGKELSGLEGSPLQSQQQQPPRTGSGGSDSGSGSIEQAMARLSGELQQPSVIPFECITWCKHPDGSLVELGSGAFSTVYRVLLDRVQPYAAKVVRLDENPEDFIKEASMLRQLRHRNIVQFAGVSVEGERGILLTELCEGRDLRSRLGSLNKAGERLFSYFNRGKMVLFDTACALHYLHSHSITHFDVKGSNVLLSRDGTAKLADVAFAKTMRNTQHSITEGRSGTWSYMAPELLLGQPCNELVDIYSWGVLLWEILTGEEPTRGCLRELRVPEECPHEVAAMFLECIDNDPVNRPTARNLVQRLSQLLQRPPVA